MPSETWASLMAKAEAPQTSSGKVLPKGSYKVEIKSVKVSNRNGKDKVALLLEVIEGDEKGEKFWDNWTVSPESPKALGIFFENFSRCGGSLETLQMGGKLEAASAGMVGKQMTVSLDIREYPVGSGVMQNQTGFYRQIQSDIDSPPPAKTATKSTTKGPF